MCSSLGSRRGLTGRSRVFRSFTGYGPAWVEGTCRGAGLCVSCIGLGLLVTGRLDFCSRVGANGLGSNWAYGFGLRQLGHGSRRVLG